MDDKMAPNAKVRRDEPGNGRPPKAPSVGRAARRGDVDRQGLAAILALVRSGEAQTRHDIELLSGLGRAAVADRLAVLLDIGLLEEGELGPAAGGRAPRLLRFRSKAGLVLVAVFGQTTIGVGIADLAGRLLFEHHEAADHNFGPEAILKRLVTLFDWGLEQYQDGGDVWGIGVAVPGPVEAVDANPFASPKVHFMPSWADYPFVEHIALRYRALVCLRSRVQMMALGELRAGSGGGVKTLLLVDLGREISAALISDGRLHRGTQGSAGMIGHIFTDEENTTICRCGNTGCLEAVAGADAIASEGLRAAQDGRSAYLATILAAGDKIAVTDVLTAAQHGDAFSAELLARCGRLVGTALAALVNTLNPSLITLAGTIAQNGDTLLAAIRETVYRRSHPLVTRDLRIVRSQMGSSASLVGAALTAVDELFSPKFLGGWISAGTPLAHPELLRFAARAEQTTRPKPPTKNAPSRNDQAGGMS